ncbi:PH domain-containing protein [Streptomyces sp. CA-111067]|uniref:PH domain-containing protein n=1 Tax=Streptomyces sp. CA-111067 TaxID=3240046 RepID=UPI003D9732E8
MTRTKWGPRFGAWLLTASLVFVVFGAVRADLVHSPAVWLVFCQTLGVAGYTAVVLRMTWWGVTATPEGLRVRNGRTVRFLPWADVTGAAAVNGGNLTIIGAEPEQTTVIEWAGFRPPTRAAAEITALVTDPGLRPAA